MTRIPLTRRNFLGTAVAGAGALALEACSSSNNNTSPQATAGAPSVTAGSPAASAGSPAAGGAPATVTRPAGSPAAAATQPPRKGGTLIVGTTADLELNTGFPFVFLNSANYVMQYAVFETLITYTDSLQPTLVLADRFEYNSDHSKLTVAIKQGATFHNGAPVTPEDVFFPISILQDPSKYQLPAAFQLTPSARTISAMNKIDARTMEFTFSEWHPDVTDMFAQLQITQMSSYAKLQAGQDLQGTGPYKFQSWSPKQGFKLVANPSWYGSSRTGGPFLDGVEVREFADQDAMGLAFQSGDLDVIYGTLPTIAKNYQAKGLTRVTPRVGISYMGVVTNHTPFDDKRVRQAIFMSVDRQRFNDDLGAGFTTVTTQPWPKTSPAFDPNLEKAWFDQAKAKDLLKQAGFSQSQPFMLEYSPVTTADPAVPPLLQSNLDAIGIKVQLVPLDNNVYVQKFRDKQFKDLYLHVHGFSQLSPLTMFLQAAPYQGPQPNGMPGNPAFFADQAYLDIVSALKPLDAVSDAAKQQYAKFNALWLDRPWMNAFGESIRIDLVGAKVRGHDTYKIARAYDPDYGAIWKTG